MSYVERLKNLVYNGAAWIEQLADASSSATITLDFAHHEIHEGEHYTVADFTDLANGATYNLLFVTPDTTVRIHMLFQVATEAEATITLFEDTTTSSDGTAITEVCNRRDASGGTADLVVTHTPTITGDGTQLARGKTGSGRQLGGEIRGEDEWILDQNSKYMLRITNDTATNNWVSWLIAWYEHTDDA